MSVIINDVGIYNLQYAVVAEEDLFRNKETLRVEVSKIKAGESNNYDHISALIRLNYGDKVLATFKRYYEEDPQGNLSGKTVRLDKSLTDASASLQKSYLDVSKLEGSSNYQMYKKKSKEIKDRIARLSPDDRTYLLSHIETLSQDAFDRLRARASVLTQKDINDMKERMTSLSMGEIDLLIATVPQHPGDIEGLSDRIYKLKVEKKMDLYAYLFPKIYRKIHKWLSS
jgi:hypothetical protein